MLLNINATRGPRIAAQRPMGCCSARLLGCGTRSPLYLIGDAASRRGLSRVGYFITLNGPLNGHPPSVLLFKHNVGQRLTCHGQLYRLVDICVFKSEIAVFGPMPFIYKNTIMETGIFEVTTCTNHTGMTYYSLRSMGRDQPRET